MYAHIRSHRDIHVTVRLKEEVMNLERGHVGRIIGVGRYFVDWVFICGALNSNIIKPKLCVCRLRKCSVSMVFEQHSEIQPQRSFLCAWLLVRACTTQAKFSRAQCVAAILVMQSDNSFILQIPCPSDV